jgi:uncharacterized protein (TIGR00369 family)
VLRDLPFDLEQVDATAARAHLVLTGPTCEAGTVDPGAVMTAVDVLAGSLVGRVVAPDWMATAELALHLGDVGVTSGELVADARVIRDGRTTIVLDARLRVGASEVGELVLTFVRLPRRDTTIDLSSYPVTYGERTRFDTEGPGLDRPYGEALGIEVVDAAAGVCRLPVTPYVRNSFGAVNGGVVATLAQRSGRAVAAAGLGDHVRTSDVVVHYLAQGRVGPLATTGRVLRAGGRSVQVRVEVVDQGRVGDDGVPEVVALAHVRSCLPDT